MVSKRHETPLRRVNPSGEVRWVARWTNRDGVRASAGTFELRREAQAAIDAAYEADEQAALRPVDRDAPATVGDFHVEWRRLYPRAARTAAGYEEKLRQVLDVPIGGRVLRDWPMRDVDRAEIRELIDVLLRVQGRSAGGATGVLRVLSALFSDARDHGTVRFNPFAGVKIKATDPRIQKAPREIQTWSWEQMHELARAAGRHRTGSVEVSAMDRWRATYAEPMVRVLSDCGIRLGELLPLERGDVKTGRCDEQGCDEQGPHLHVRRTAHEGVVQAGTKVDHGTAGAGRVVPLSAGLLGLLRGMPPQLGGRLFSTPTGNLWWGNYFYRQVWWPARDMVPGMGSATPHEFRHSWISLLLADGVDRADLAAMAGHTVMTMTSKYTHSLGRSMDVVRGAVGG